MHFPPPPSPPTQFFLVHWDAPRWTKDVNIAAQILGPISTAITEKTISVDISVNISDSSTNKVSIDPCFLGHSL